MPRSQHRVPVRIHAFELLAGNQKLLQLLFQRLHVPGEVHAVALSNSTGTLWAPLITRTGQENVAASTEPLKQHFSIPTTSIDAYASRAGLQQLDWVTLDAEGWDGLIIRGGSHMLRNRRIGILEFEYSAKSWVSREPVRVQVAPVATVTGSKPQGPPSCAVHVERSNTRTSRPPAGGSSG
jgi:FkbM family methyltransferase